MGARKSKVPSSTTTTNQFFPPVLPFGSLVGTLPNFSNLGLSNFAGPLGLPFGSTLGPLAQLPQLAALPPPPPLPLPPISSLQQMPPFSNLGPIAGFGGLSNLSNLGGLNPFIAGHIGNSPLLPLAMPFPGPIGPASFNGFVGY
jgi:hypothetical protein